MYGSGSDLIQITISILNDDRNDQSWGQPVIYDLDCHERSLDFDSLSPWFFVSFEPLSYCSVFQTNPRFRIHHDASANRSSDSLNAKAYTLGEDIVFGPGQFAPSQRTGLELLAHELTHVVQNNGRDFKPRNSLRNLSRQDAAETQASNVEANLFNIGRTSITRGLPGNGESRLRRKPKDQAPPQPPPLSTGIRKGAQLGGGRISFYPRSASKTRQGSAPSEVGSRDMGNRLSVIIGAGITIQTLAEYLLPLWNEAQPSRPDADLGEATVPATPLTADQLARALADYNAGILQNMKQWNAGLRFPLPVVIDEKSGEGVVNSPGILARASAFDEAKIGWLTQPAGAQATQDDSQVTDAAKNFLKDNPNPTARGYGLANRAPANAEHEQRFILECLAQMPETERLDAAIWFMDLVGNKADVLSAQNGSKIKTPLGRRVPRSGNSTQPRISTL